MPFQSKRQQRKCYAMRAKGKAKGWDCDEWSDETNFKKLPARARHKKGSAGPSFIEKIAVAAAMVTIGRRPS